MLTVSAWPMCNTPVTLGGGMIMEKGEVEFGLDGLNIPCELQVFSHLHSISPGTYCARGFVPIAVVVNVRERISAVVVAPLRVA